MPYANNNGVNIHYKVEGNGPPLVLHHWSLATLESWYDFGYVSALRDEFQLILFDSRGHGASDKPHVPEAYALENRVRDMEAILDDLGIDKAHFFGYSMGGWIGFGIPLYAPHRFHSLIIGGQHPYAQSLDGLRQFARCGFEKGAEAFMVMWEKEIGPLSDEQRVRISAYDFEALLMVAQDRESLETVLPDMTMPCLLFIGEKDDACPVAEKSARCISNATFVTLPNLDHGQSIERCDLVIPHIKKFLAAANV